MEIILKINQIEILEWKSTIIEITSLGRLNIRFEISRRKQSANLNERVNWDYPIWETTECLNIWAAKLMREIDNLNIIVGDFDTPLSIMDKWTRQHRNGRLEQH